ncbi:MAG: hypothetical protein NTX59_00445 [Elusimicrobia bacterium]|nr:hypothetical protein [Elusimicrobiota bacterium]
MAKRSNNLLIAATLLFAVSGILSAADFEKDIKNTENLIAGYKAGSRLELPVVAPVPAPPTPGSGTKWYSVTFFGSTHKYIAKAALKFMDRGAFPDMAAAKDLLVEGSEDESGHTNSTMNGGPVREIWFGNTPFSKGGVLWNYEHFKFPEAYSRLGTICHLTQDQGVPTHAANIQHGISDSFEGFYGSDVKISVKRDNGELEPWEYYQALQDETRSKLPGWTDPKTGLQYWVTAPDAPPLGQDVTYGPWGHYGGRRGWDMYAVPPPNNNNNSHGNNNQPWTTAHPEIRLEQLAVSGVATVSVLESASKRLPPLVQSLSVSTISVQSGGRESRGYQINFNIYENRSPNVTYKINVYRDGSFIGTAVTGAAALYPPKDGGIMFSGAITAYWWHGAVNFKPLPAGKYELDVRVMDADGNTTPEDVNNDDIPDNDTRAAVVLN